VKGRQDRAEPSAHGLVFGGANFASSTHPMVVRCHPGVGKPGAVRAGDIKRAC